MRRKALSFYCTQVTSARDRLPLTLLGFALGLALGSLFPSSGFAKELAIDLQTTPASVQRVNELLKNHGGAFSPVAEEAAEETFRARTSAHRIRNAQIFVELAQDSKFQKQFPEFKPLFDRSTETIESILKHDAAKVSEGTKSATRVLSLLQGFDYRNPPKTMPREAAEELSGLLRHAIDDINHADNRIMSETMKKFSPNRAWEKLHGQFMESVDLYDTYKSRQDEIAKDGRKLLKPSDWIDNLESSRNLSADEKSESAIKKKFAKYLEEADPLRDPKKFAKTEDFLKATQGRTSAKAIDNKFLSLSRSLVSDVTEQSALRAPVAGRFNGKAKTVFKKIGSGAGGTVAVAGAITSAKYLWDPEKVTGNTFFEDLSGASDLGDCTTRGCYAFIQSCAELLKIPNANPATVQAHPKYEICLNRFFEQPLDAQLDQRRDPDLDQLLNKTSPFISEVVCRPGKGRVAVDLKMRLSSGVFIDQQLQYAEDGKLQRIRSLNDHGEDRIVFEKGIPQMLQHCPPLKNCENKTMMNVQRTRLYAWQNESRIPNESMRWAKRNLQLIETQANSILKHCQSPNQPRIPQGTHLNKPLQPLQTSR